MTPSPAPPDDGATAPTPDGAPGRIVWIDLEMTGLDPSKERIIEIATIVTESDLEIVAEGPELVVHQPDSILDRMDNWNRKQHGGSGLIDRVRASEITERQAERQTLAFLEEHCPKQQCPLAGNSVHHDRRFLRRGLPRVSNFLHYRIIDVSTIKELVRRWYPNVEMSLEKPDSHRALDDIRASIAELRHYRDTVFRDAASLA